LAKLDIPAVRRGRIAIIDDPLAHTPSTAMIGVARAMARALEPWD
jgi:ABC-type Fe3+-hydroxamate transport system substrate-binding protein